MFGSRVKVASVQRLGETACPHGRCGRRPVDPGSTMPRFHFDTLDGEGCEFGSLDEAQPEAAWVIGDMAHDALSDGTRRGFASTARDGRDPVAMRVTSTLRVERFD